MRTMTKTLYELAEQYKADVLNRIVSLEIERDEILTDIYDPEMQDEINADYGEQIGHWQATLKMIDETLANPIPKLACPKCGADDSDCLRDAFIDVDYPDGDNSTVVYRYCCPKCGTYFKETLKRVSVEKF